MTELPQRLDEQVLLLRCQAGDAQAFERIVARYGTRLHYYLLKLIGNGDLADDALQDIWLDVYRGIRRLRDPVAFRAWIYRIARDRAFRLIRRTRPRHVPVAQDEVVANEGGDEEFGAEDAARIHAALETLSPEHREVLLLRFIEDLSYFEIADIIGRNVGTVKSRVHYAKRMLRRAIQEDFDD